MPAPALLAPLLAGGATSAFNALSTNFQNAKSREWSRQMYDRQYSDNINFWRMQNAYNDPSAQMARLRKAGLNPALLYGGSGAGASGQSGAIASPDVQRPEFNAPRIGDFLGEGLTNVHQIYDLEVKEQQLDNLKSDNLVKLNQAMLLASQANRSQFDLGVETDLRSITLEARREAVRKAVVDRKFQISENDRRNMQNAVTLKQGISNLLNDRIRRAKDREEIERLKSLKKNIDADTGLKYIERDLLDIGLSKNSNILLKMLARALQNAGPKESFSDRLGRILEYLFTPNSPNYQRK